MKYITYNNNLYIYLSMSYIHDLRIIIHDGIYQFCEHLYYCISISIHHYGYIYICVCIHYNIPLLYTYTRAACLSAAILRVAWPGTLKRTESRHMYEHTTQSYRNCQKIHAHTYLYKHSMK